MGCDCKYRLLNQRTFLISIHAPIVGCDKIMMINLTQMFDFNPRTHRGVRRMGTSEVLNVGKFQSTHPSWGATYFRAYNNVKFREISIHAPIVGCDMINLFILSLFILFQSTHPSWGATNRSKHIYTILKNFNPRTHRGVRPLTVIKGPAGGAISIHAPIVGCDPRLL